MTPHERQLLNQYQSTPSIEVPQKTVLTLDNHDNRITHHQAPSQHRRRLKADGSTDADLRRCLFDRGSQNVDQLVDLGLGDDQRR